MKRNFRKFILLAIILLLCNMQLSSYALTNKVPSNNISKKGSTNIMRIPDSKVKYNGEYYFKIDNLNVSISKVEKDFSTPINEFAITDRALKNSTYRDMLFAKNKLIVIYEILNEEFIPHYNNTFYTTKNDSKNTDIKYSQFKKSTQPKKDIFISTTPDKTPKKTFTSRGNLILFYDISDIQNIKLENKLYIHGDYETTVQKDNTLYVLSSVASKEGNNLFNNTTSYLKDIINIGNAKSDRIHNLTKVDLIEQNFKIISSIKCDSIIEYLSNDSLYFINLNDSKSTIYRLSFSFDKLKYINNFSVDGYLTNPKFINEYNRKLTFIYQSEENYKNYNLVLLDENLDLLKAIKNINNSKALTSVQFHKDSVKMLIDNSDFKIVDFSTPSNPKISEL